MKFRTVVVLLFLLAASSVPISATAQPEAETVRFVDQLLDELWDGDVPTRRRADDRFQKWNKTYDPLDSRVQWAYVLNRLKYDQYRQARSAVNGLSDRMPDNWNVRYAELWLQMMVGEVDAALIHMREFKDQLLADPNLDESGRQAWFAHLGRLIGYAEGPANADASAATLERTIDHVTSGLNDIHFGALQDHRAQVTQQFNGLVEHKTSTVKKRLEQQRVRNAQRATEIVNENQQLDDRQAEINQKIIELQDQGNQQLAKLQQDAAPIESDLARIESQLRIANERIFHLQNEIAALELAAARRPPDCHRRRFLLLQARLLRDDWFVEEAYASGLRSEYNSALAQLDVIYGQIEALEQRIGGQIAMREAENREIQKRQRRNQREMKQLQQPRIQRTGFVRDIESRTEHLPTYAPFPTEEFRQQLLKSIR